MHKSNNFSRIQIKEKKGREGNFKIYDGHCNSIGELDPQDIFILVGSQILNNQCSQYNELSLKSTIPKYPLNCPATLKYHL